MNISQFTSKTVAIVRFVLPKAVKDAIEAGMMMPQRDILYQVTIDPEALSPSEDLIRFGMGGDEITGWQSLDSIELVEILAINGRLNTETNAWDFDKVIPKQMKAA